MFFCEIIQEGQPGLGTNICGAAPRARGNRLEVRFGKRAFWIHLGAVQAFKGCIVTGNGRCGRHQQGPYRSQDSGWNHWFFMCSIAKSIFLVKEEGSRDFQRRSTRFKFQGRVQSHFEPTVSFTIFRLEPLVFHEFCCEVNFSD